MASPGVFGPRDGAKGDGPLTRGAAGLTGASASPPSSGVRHGAHTSSFPVAAPYERRAVRQMFALLHSSEWPYRSASAGTAAEADDGVLSSWEQGSVVYDGAVRPGRRSWAALRARASRWAWPAAMAEDREDVPGDERGESGVESGAGGHGGQDQGELAAGQEAGGDLGGGLGAAAVHAGDEESRGDVHDDGRDRRRGDRADDGDDVAGVDGEPEGEEGGTRRGARTRRGATLIAEAKHVAEAPLIATAAPVAETTPHHGGGTHREGRPPSLGPHPSRVPAVSRCRATSQGRPPSRRPHPTRLPVTRDGVRCPASSPRP